MVTGQRELFGALEVSRQFPDHGRPSLAKLRCSLSFSIHSRPLFGSALRAGHSCKKSVTKAGCSSLVQSLCFCQIQDRTCWKAMCSETLELVYFAQLGYLLTFVTSAGVLKVYRAIQCSPPAAPWIQLAEQLCSPSQVHGLSRAKRRIAGKLDLRSASALHRLWSVACGPSENGGPGPSASSATTYSAPIAHLCFPKLHASFAPFAWQKKLQRRMHSCLWPQCVPGQRRYMLLLFERNTLNWGRAGIAQHQTLWKNGIQSLCQVETFNSGKLSCNVDIGLINPPPSRSTRFGRRPHRLNKDDDLMMKGNLIWKN